MARFYLPALIRVRRQPVIVYPDEEAGNLLSRDALRVAEYLKEIYDKNNLLRKGDRFAICIFWRDENDLMTDLWRFSQLDNWGSGALSKEDTFRGFDLETECGTSAEYGHSVIGREAEHRFGRTLKQYLDTRPVLHPRTTNGKVFFNE